MSKAAIQQAEAQHQELLASDERTVAEVSKVKAQSLEKKANQETIRSNLVGARQETATLKSKGLKVREDLDKRKQILNEIRAQHETAALELKRLSASRGAAQAASTRLAEARSGLEAVRFEISALASEHAKTAALAAEGGDLPREAAPPPTSKVSVAAASSSGDPALWLETAGEESVTDEALLELRPGLQAQAVLAALQASLVIRAAELREGLRQWSFTCSARARADELCRGLEQSEREGREQIEACRAESAELGEEHEERSSDLVMATVRHSALQRKHEETGEKMQGTTAASEDLRAGCEAARTRAVIFRDTHERTRLEHDEVCRQLEGKQAELEEFPAQAERRGAAAARLLQRGVEHVEQCKHDLETAREELESFRKAHEVLQEAHAQVGAQLAKEQAILLDLREAHDHLGSDLNLLAKHYLDALPPGLFGGERLGHASLGQTMVSPTNAGPHQPLDVSGMLVAGLS